MYTHNQIGQIDQANLSNLAEHISLHRALFEKKIFLDLASGTQSMHPVV
jgi:hypothetical protein